MELPGRTVIVTGAGSGIGRALALAFARHGAGVVCCARRFERLEETVRLIERDGGVGFAQRCDVTRREEVQTLVTAALERFGQIDVLFNNAGSFQSIAGVAESDPDTWWTDVSVNMLGGYLTIREVLPHMLTRDTGIIVNMDGGRPVGGSGYACGKAGLMELTRVLSKELRLLGSAVMVFGAGPGLVRTEMTELQAQSEAGRRWIPSTQAAFAAGSTRQPEELARATIELIRIATPEVSGKSYGPDTDFSTWFAAD